MFSAQNFSTPLKRNAYGQNDDHREIHSKRIKICENYFNPASDCLRNHFPNPLHMDSDVIDDFIWKLKDPFIFRKCCQIANICLPLSSVHDFSPPPPLSFEQQDRIPSEYYNEYTLPRYSSVSFTNDERNHQGMNNP